MDELRKNHILELLTRDNDKINGIVADYEKDRVMVAINEDSIEAAKKIHELDDFIVTAHTHFGIKKMKSSTISALGANNCLIIENNPSFPVVQKREFVRVLSDIAFTIEKNGTSCQCKCINISGGGIAFCTDETEFNIDDEFIINFSSDDFQKDITLEAKIVKINPHSYAAKYINPNEYDVDKIVKYVFNLISKQ